MRIFAMLLIAIGEICNSASTPVIGNELKPLEVTLGVYSGVKDPLWVVYPDDALYLNLLHLLQSHASSEPPSALGYRGFEVQERANGCQFSGWTVAAGSNRKLERNLLYSGLHSRHRATVKIVKEILCSEVFDESYCPGFTPTEPHFVSVTEDHPSTSDFSSAGTTSPSISETNSGTRFSEISGVPASLFPTPSTTPSKLFPLTSQSLLTISLHSLTDSSVSSFSTSTPPLPQTTNVITPVTKPLPSTSRPLFTSRHKPLTDSSVSSISTSTPPFPQTTKIISPFTVKSTSQFASSHTSTPSSSATSTPETTVTPPMTPKPCNCPKYKPNNWNNNQNVRKNNNCYNYATNLRTGTFAQPGRGSGKTYKDLTGPAVKDAAVCDGLKVLADPGAGKFPKTNDCLVALVIWKGKDFHWYRQDKNGNWSHKAGSTPVTNKDNSGNLITDPRTADLGPYKFVTFMSYCPGGISIRK